MEKLEKMSYYIALTKINNNKKEIKLVRVLGYVSKDEIYMHKTKIGNINVWAVDDIDTGRYIFFAPTREKALTLYRSQYASKMIKLRKQKKYKTLMIDQDCKYVD